jgi:DNA-binding CsgD family transcriptional regulator/tetratricopeptide (TPR) repeat protein
LHRAEVLALAGEWEAALSEAAHACDRLARPHHPALAAARYLRADLNRLRGLTAEAEADYQRAGELGVDPQPGLALLRLDQGRTAHAQAAISRAWQQAGDPFTPVRLAPAYVEIMLAAGAVQEAREALDVLGALPAELNGPYLRAVHTHLDGWVRLAVADPSAASALRRAAGAWRELGMPYHLARVRMLLAQAHRDLGDREGAEMELAAARRVFAGLGARPDLARADAVLVVPRPAAGGLTAREIEVLALVARGRSNREIASELVLSEKTVATHLSHILAKLEVPSRTAATAYAYEHGLIG